MDREPGIPAVATEPGRAATVVLLRDGELGVEVLLAERPRDRGSFAGAWVFPGGVVEPGDLDGEDPAGEAVVRRAAARETSEEIGLVVDPAELVPFSEWTPPAGAPKRFVTTFFAVRVPDGELRPAPDEVVAVEWIRPAEALERHARGAMILWPPTWVTLHGLASATSVDAALRTLASGVVRPYVARMTADRSTILWQEDAEYDLAAAASASGTDAEAGDGSAEPTADGAPAENGHRHRLVMDRLPWVYLNSF